MPSYLQQALLESQRGNLTAALTHAEAAVRERQDGAKPCLVAAFAAAQLGGNELALRWVERGLALEPDDCLVLAAHAHLLASLDRWEAALQSSRRWAALAPLAADAHLFCARAHAALRQFPPALDSYQRAAAAAEKPAAPLTDLAILLYELGRPDDAGLALDLALAADPGFAAAWYTRSDAKRFTHGDPDISAMRDMLARSAADPTSQQDAILLHYALGKAYADLDDFGEALAHLRAGAALKRATLNYDVALDETFMTDMAQAFTGATLERLAGAGSATRVPIFIVGMPRSGTSLLEQVFASHPQVHGGGESARMQSLVATLGPNYPASLKSLSRGELGSLAERYLALLPVPAATHVTDKTPYNFLHLGLIHAMFPQACIIHCRRDPHDTCASIFATWFAQGNEFSYDTRELVRYYRCYAALMQHWRTIIPPSGCSRSTMNDWWAISAWRHAARSSSAAFPGRRRAETFIRSSGRCRPRASIKYADPCMPRASGARNASAPWPMSFGN